jgi:hypothetical protein
MSDVKRECIQVGASATMYVLATDHDAEVSRLRAELEEARRDAARYRWIRHKDTPVVEVCNAALDKKPFILS